MKQPLQERRASGYIRRHALSPPLRRMPPPRVEELREVEDGEPRVRHAASCKMKDDGGLHRREEGVAGGGVRVVEEVGLGDSPVLRGGRCFPDDPAFGIEVRKPLWGFGRRPPSVKGRGNAPFYHVHFCPNKTNISFSTRGTSKRK